MSARCLHGLPYGPCSGHLAIDQAAKVVFDDLLMKGALRQLWSPVRLSLGEASDVGS